MSWRPIATVAAAVLLAACSDAATVSEIGSFTALCPSQQNEGSISGLRADVSFAGHGVNTTVIIDFGDGSRQEWKHAHFGARGPEGFGSHTYSRPGIYSATVTVRDARGGSKSETCRIQVPPPWQSTAAPGPAK